MRMVPTSHMRLGARRGPQSRAKRGPAAKIAHMVAPLKGLSQTAEVNEIDPQYASILTNWVVQEDRITVRPGYTLVSVLAGAPPISTMIPWYGVPSKMVAAAGTKLYNLDASEAATGFTNANWAWTSFTNLSTNDYTIMVNGADGVRSWNGTTFATETISAPTGESWVLPAKFDKVISHMNRLWFADSENLAVYYLPIQQKSGTLELLPLNAIFRYGGYIMAIHTWTRDGGAGMDDAIVIFSSNGEAAIYSGVDPGSDFGLIGVFRFDSPMSKNSIVNFGGDLYVLISSGLVPMSAMLKNETEGLGKADRNVVKEFSAISKANRDKFGWQTIINHPTNHIFCNMPLGDNKYQQMVRLMPGAIWTKWLDIPSRCWGWHDDHMYFGTDDGKIYKGGTEYLSDYGEPIHADVRFAWSSYRSAAKKNFKLIRLYTITDGLPRPFIDMEVDYNNVPPTNQPEMTVGSEVSTWDLADWDDASWVLNEMPRRGWQGVTGLGRVGAPHIRVDVVACKFSITGLDVLYEEGGVM